MSGEVDIIIPHLCVKHIEPLQMLSASSKVANVITSLSLLTGMDKKTLYRCRYSDVIVAAQAIMSQADKDIRNTRIRKSVEINGNRYRLLDASKITVGWAIDYSLLEDKKPTHIAALMYIEEGKDYADTDLMQRAEVMNDLPLADYAAATSFFLRILQIATQAWEIQRRRREKKAIASVS